MKVIILAAGQGTRLRPYTDHRPKALVELWGSSLLERQLDILTTAGIDRKNITVVTGYQAEKIEQLGLSTVRNPHFASSNMLTSLFCAEALFTGDEDVLVTYGDVLYTPELVQMLIASSEDLAVPGNLNWLELWEKRMDNPYDDVESFVYDENNMLLDIGQKVNDSTEVMAQYMGLFKVKADFCQRFIDAYAEYLQVSRSSKLNNLYITDFLQYLAKLNRVSACLYPGGWIEVDSAEDLHFYQKNVPAEFGVM